VALGLSLAELDRWDPDAIHTVFEAAMARAEHTRSTATSIGDVVLAVPGSGQAFDAAAQATGSIQTDLIDHADQVDAVGRAAATAEHEVRDVKSQWQALSRRAYDEGFTIDLDTNEISYTGPAESRQAAEMARKFDRLHSDIEALLARANTADGDLASAIRGAAGQESPEDVNRDLDERGEPPQPMDELTGREDGQAAIDGTMSDEARSRLDAATALSPQQALDLQNGNLVLSPDQLAYLTGVSKQFGNMTPEQIVKTMNAQGDHGKGLAGALQLASNPNVGTGRFGAGDSGRAPTKGGVSGLPAGVQSLLKADPLDYSPVVRDPKTGMPTPMAGPMAKTGLNDLAEIVKRSDPALRVGSGLDQALMDKSRELLRDSNGAALPSTADGKEWDRPHWYQSAIDPTLENMLGAVAPDSKLVHDTITGPDGQSFLTDLHSHQWADRGQAAASLFHSVDANAINNPNDPMQSLLAQRAAQTARIEAGFLGDSHHDMLNLGGTRENLGQMNPALAQGLAQSLGHYIPAMVGDPLGDTGDFGKVLTGDEDNDNYLHVKNLFAALDGDPTAANTLHQAADQAGRQFLDRTAGAMDTGDGLAEQHMAALGRLHAAMDVGMATDLNDLRIDHYVGDKAKFDSAKNWANFWPDLIAKVPGGDAVADPLKDLLAAGLGDGPQQPTGLTSQERGNNVALYGLMQSLYDQNVGDTSELGKLVDPDSSGEFLSPHDALGEHFGTTLEAMRKYMTGNTFGIDPNWLLSQYGQAYHSGMTNGRPGVDQTTPDQ
jgi:hypothetical protein